MIFGGAYSNGNLVDNDLYLLKLMGQDGNGKWIKVPIKGQKPKSRYGHTMSFIKPYIILIGGTIGQDPSNEVWILSIEQSPFIWTQLNFINTAMPEERVYHSNCIWRNRNKTESLILFGGRNRE